MKQNTLTLILLFSLFCLTANAQTVLQADGPGSTYELINSVFAPNNEAVESAECVHPEFGRHIAEVLDTDLQKYVFEFYIHVTPDNDRCINFDRQRVEIKTYEPSPANLKGVSGETVTYKWRFKLPTGFQPSANFTHIHQVKAVGGDDDDPLFVLTARKGSPDKLELNYYESSILAQQQLTSANLSLFINTWVEATETIKIHNTNGSYSIVIKNVSTGATLLSYSNSKLLTIRSDNDFIRPKWGIYRSLASSSDLRDESIRFAYFSIQEGNLTDVNQTIIDENEITVSTNTLKQTATITFPLDSSEKASVRIIDLNGCELSDISNKITSLSNKAIVSANISGLAPGIYLAHVKTQHYSVTKKFIVKN